MRSRSCAFCPSIARRRAAEKTVFAVDHRCDLRIRLTPRGELRRESDGGEAVALGNQTGDAPRRLVKLLGDELQAGSGDGVVETRQHVALPHHVAFPDLEHGDDAARRMLHALDV